MAQSIVDMFYALGGYSTNSYETEGYVSSDLITGTYIPLAVKYFNGVCEGVKTVSIGTSSSSGDIFDDRILAELSLWFADSSYDTIHVDPDTYQTENRHYTIAESLILKVYGQKDAKGDVVYPVYADDTQAYADMDVATLSY